MSLKGTKCLGQWSSWPGFKAPLWVGTSRRRPHKQDLTNRPRTQATRGPVVQPGILTTSGRRTSGLQTTAVEPPEGRGFKSRTVHHISISVELSSKIRNILIDSRSSSPIFELL